jgi:hypothetical protein
LFSRNVDNKTETVAIQTIFYRNDKILFLPGSIQTSMVMATEMDGANKGKAQLISSSEAAEVQRHQQKRTLLLWVQTKEEEGGGGCRQRWHR